MAKLDPGQTRAATNKAKAMGKAIPSDAPVKVGGPPNRSLGSNTRGVAGGAKQNVITNLGGGRSSAPKGTRQTAAIPGGRIPSSGKATNRRVK